MPRQEFLFPSFSGGLADGLANDTAPEGTLRVCDNADFSKAPIGGITARPPMMMRGTPTTTERMRWLVRFPNYKESQWPYALIGSDKIYPVNRIIDEFGTPKDLTASLDSWYALPDEDKIYFIGGIEPMVLDLDLEVKRMGRRVENTWQAALIDGAMVAGDYYYKLILTDKNGRRMIAGDYAKVTTAATPNDGVRWTDLPVCEGDHKYLYRTCKDASETDTDNPMVYYLVAVLEGQDTTHDDTLVDTDITVNEILDTTQFAHPPNDLAYMTIHNGLAFGFTQDSSILRYTPQFDYENWPEINAIPMGDPDYLTALAPVGDVLLAFKKNKTYGFLGSNINNFDYRELSTVHGTNYPKTIKALDSNRAIFLDSQRRVILYNGGSFTEISKTIKLPTSFRYWASLYKDYYVLWMYSPSQVGRDAEVGPPRTLDEIPDEGPYFRWDSPGQDDNGDIEWPPPGGGEGEGGEGGGGGGGGDGGGGGGGQGDGYYNDAIWFDDDLRGSFYNAPDIDDGPIWISGDSVDFNREVVAYCYHIPTGAWTRWTNIRASLPELPDRPGENLVFYDGHQLGVIGLRGNSNQEDAGDFVVRTIDSDCGTPNQKKSFKEVEIYFEHIDRWAYEGMVGQLDIIVDDGSASSSVFQKEIIYNSLNPFKRQRFRIRNGANGTRVSVRFTGTQDMFRFSLLQVRVWWEPRGTAIR